MQNLIIHSNAIKFIIISSTQLTCTNHQVNCTTGPSHTKLLVGQIRCNLRSTKIYWSIPLPKFKQNWTTLVDEDIIIPRYSIISFFVCPSIFSNAQFANFVSAKNQLGPYPPSLKQALHPSNPEHHIWINSYNEGKGGLESHNIVECVNKK